MPQLVCWHLSPDVRVGIGMLTHVHRHFCASLKREQVRPTKFGVTGVFCSWSANRSPYGWWERGNHVPEFLHQSDRRVQEGRDQHEGCGDHNSPDDSQCSIISFSGEETCMTIFQHMYHKPNLTSLASSLWNVLTFRLKKVAIRESDD